jgi:hypothetical protein
MNRRCFDPRNHNYKYYGARGITVCDRWRVFENFLADMGIRSEGLTIERIDNDGNYEPSNCCWIPKSEQSRNQRDRHGLGITKSKNGKFRAYIYRLIDGQSRQIHLGTFSTETDARSAVNRARAA